MIAAMLGFVGLWLLLDRSAAGLGSFRGEAGLLVCLIVVGAALLLEMALARRGPRASTMALGLGAPRLQAALWSLVFAAGLIALLPLYALATGTELTLMPNAAWLALGMFAQGGIAEEAVFRGFLFRRLREGRSFWRAALLSMLPFAAVHALLFLTLDFYLALAALAVALSISFPLAWLFERAGGSIWPCAIAHAAIQAPIKLVEAGDAFIGLALIWMAVSMTAPWLFFLLRPQKH